MLKYASILPVIFLLCGLPLVSCNEEIKKNKSHPETNNTSIREGKKLAATWCQSCHLLPDPALLDSKSWEEGVLPHMGPRLGIFEFNFKRYPVYMDRNVAKNFYPGQAAMDAQQWQSIIDYYGATSPDTLTRSSNSLPVKLELPIFKIEYPTLRYNNPAISFIKINKGENAAELIAGDLKKQTLYRFNSSLEVIDSLRSSGAIVDINFQEKGMLTLNMGVFNPTNEKYGEARYITFNQHHKMQKDTMPLFDKLQRPVQLISADLDNDGKNDYLTCGFGFLTGELSWMKALGNNKFEQRVIRAVPGAERAYVQDYNKDGLPDIWVLFAQGEEGIFIFTNKGGGRFEEKEIMRFPAMYGSSYFELADFNKDGFPDIVYTCGDNADYSTVLKPYHGVYIFINDGTNNFKQQFFYPVNGCYKAIARDFDNDGDLDIATISYFADYVHQPEEGFVYLENMGGFKFQPRSFPEAKLGRWISMDAADLDGDGKLDIVLGNFAEGPEMMRSAVDWKKGPPFIFLKNIIK